VISRLGINALPFTNPAYRLSTDPQFPQSGRLGFRPDSDVGNMVLSEDIGAGDGGKLRPETDIGAFRARRKAWV
jgi:hypothetical protein